MRWPNHVRYRKSNNRFRGTALNRPTRIGIGILLFATSALASAQQPVRQPIVEKAVVLNLAAQPLEDALHEFSRVTGLRVMLYTVLGRGIISPRVSGTLTPGAALDLLLKGAALRFEYLDAQTIAVLPAHEQSRDATSRPMSHVESDRIRTASATETAGATDTSSYAENERVPPADHESDNKHRNELDEVVVTAQKRQERLQNVPISISVLGGADLDRSTVQGITEALNSVPGVAAPVSFGALGVGTQISVRGVSAGEPIFFGSSANAYYLDSVPFGFVKSAIAPDSDVYDLQRVEVLRGPQGTLYGASALNGVVRILTNDADLSSFELKARVSDSGTDGGGNNYRGDMAVNVPIIDGKLAARAVVGYDNESGWINSSIRDHFNDAQLRNYRVKIDAQPIEGLSIGLSEWSTRDNYAGPSVSSADNPKFHLALLDEPQASAYDAYGLKIGYEFPWFSVASMTSYLDYTTSGNLDLTFFGVPATPYYTRLTSNEFAQEITLNSTSSGSWRWSIGGMYRDARDRFFQDSPIFAAASDNVNSSKSSAVFGEATRIFLGGKLELTGGLRYFKDEVGLVEYSDRTGAPALGQVANPTFDKLTPRAVLTWHPSAETTGYASYAEGFRSGGNSDPPVPEIAPALASYRPDSLKNYELGAKGSRWHGRINFDAAVYYIDWTNIQQSLTVNLNGLPLAALVNGKSASGVGTDFGLTIEPVKGLTLAGNFSWNNLKMDANVYSGGLILFNKGDRLNYSPETTAGASADYIFPLAWSGLKGRLSLSANHTSELDLRRINNALTGPAVARGDPMFFTRASFSIESAGHWTATLFGENLNNEQGATVRVPNVEDDFSRPRPRTVGVQLECHL
jgi:iron complex outermembrane receptor protein